LSKPAKAKATPVATPSAVDDTVVKEMTAAVESVKPNTRAATAAAAKTKEAPASKTIPKPKPAASADGDAADGLTKSKSQRKNERKRERAKQRKAEEKSTTALGLRDGPVVSVQRDLY
jgi:hypothetical protein